MMLLSPSPGFAFSSVVDLNLRTLSLPALFFKTIWPSTAKSPKPSSRLAVSVAIANPFSADALAGAPTKIRVPTMARARTLEATVLLEAVFFILSIQINNGGRNRKSTNRAKPKVTAVKRAKSRFTAKPDCPKMAKPTTSASEVTVKAMPTDLNA